MQNQMMKTMMFLTMFVLMVSMVRAQDYVWNQPHAEVVATGDLKWKPQPFEFVKGETVRYIDYESGKDSNAGTSKDAAWKHLPWDTRAEGQSKAFSGIATFVFKRGVFYRITPVAGDPVWTAPISGEAGNPIRLTSDPSWGEGEAVIAGSIPIEGAWKKATAGDVPERMDTQSQTVWYVDVDVPRKPDGAGPMEMTIFEIQDNGEISTLYLASDVGWELQNPNFALHHWNTWDEYRRMGTGQGRPYQDEELKGKDPDYFTGGTLWSQYAWVIANPTPDKPIKKGDYDPQKGTLKYKKGTDPVNPGTRYLIEDLPQFLDQPGEYYYVRKYQDNKGRLFLRLPEDRDPNTVQIEMSTAFDLLHIKSKNHIDISGLAFRFNGRNPFPQSSDVILVEGSCKDISIHNCSFGHIANDAIRFDCKGTMEGIRVNDCDFNWINGGTGVEMQGNPPGQIIDAEIMRNRARKIGIYRHDDHRWSNVQALACNYATTAHIAGNIIEDTWGSGIVSQGGGTGKSMKGFDFPLQRIFVHHNKSENNALAVNDYGGLSLWQHGTIYSYSNIIGNSVGYWPGGFFNSGDSNLSYPIYLDGGFKIYNFNNISWAHPVGMGNPYASNTPAFFNVFGFMNPFVNNTVYGNGKGLGGTSGNRNDYLGNLFADVNQTFISVNHGGNPSLIGGDDDAKSGIDGATTLAYGHNIFHGKAKAGVVATVKQGAQKDVQSDDINELQKMMEDYPMRYAQLGKKVDSLPVEKGMPRDAEKPGAGDMDFRPKAGSSAIDTGVKYFVPFSLYGVVGEWDFNANHATPEMVLDYHYYPTRAYFNRSMYYRTPAYEIMLNDATLDDYVASESEDWVAGALRFDGQRFGAVKDVKMKEDFVLLKSTLNQKSIKNKNPAAPWKADGDRLVFPAAERQTLDMSTNNMLVEVILSVDSGVTDCPVVGKYDGRAGYRLVIDEGGKAAFQVAGGGKESTVASAQTVNNGKWVHIIGEADRANGELRIYVNGKLAGKTNLSLSKDASLTNMADFMVGADTGKTKFFKGAIDFMRISRGTLEDARTDIDEVYAWQTKGPALYDFAGNPTRGKRDAGALERQ